MDLPERFYKIDHLVKDRKVVSFAVLRDSLGTSHATFRRKRSRESCEKTS